MKEYKNASNNELTKIKQPENFNFIIIQIKSKKSSFFISNWKKKEIIQKMAIFERFTVVFDIIVDSKKNAHISLCPFHQLLFLLHIQRHYWTLPNTWEPHGKNQQFSIWIFSTSRNYDWWGFGPEL